MLESAAFPGPYPNSLHIPVTPQIQNTNGVLSSTTTWMLVSGTFIASGGEKYITIGNFNDDLNTTITQVGTTGSFGAYYFADDVYVSAEPSGIINFSKNQYSIYPNPSPGVFHLQIEEEAGKNFICEITDYSGRVISSEKFFTGKNSFKKEFDLTHYDNGIYFLKLRSENKLMTYKLGKF